MGGSKKIKVLRIIGECKTGGTETIALNYYRHLDHDRIAMDFLFYGDSLRRFSEELGKYGDKVVNVVDYTENLVGSVKEIRDVVKNGDYDIVHSQLNTLNMFPLLGAWLGGAKVRVCANHSTANLKYEFKKSIMKYLLRPTTKIFATHYAACSEYAGAWCFGKRAIKNNKVHIIHNAMELDKYVFSKETRARVRNREEWDGHFVIGHAGRFTEQKNHSFIVNVFNEIHKKCPEALLVFAGEGHLMDSVKAQVNGLGLDNSVKFLGVRFDVNELMQGMDLFLFPSLYEGLGNVILEAQALGLHSIISDQVPSEVRLTEYVDSLALSKTPSEWAEVVLKYSKGYPRRDTHKDLEEKGYEIISATKSLQLYYESLIK